MRESRLIGFAIRNLKQLAQIQQGAGVDVNATAQNQRSSDAAAAVQTASHVAAVKNNIVPGVNAPVGYALDIPDVSSQKSFVDNRNALLNPADTGGGVIQQKRNARLDAANASPEQRAANAKNLQGIMDPVQEKLSAVRERIDGDEKSGRATYTHEEKAAMEQAAIAEGNAEIARQQIDQKNATEKAKASATNTAATKGAKPATPEDQTTAGLLAAIPPEQQWMAPLLKNLLDSQTKAAQEQASLAQTLFNGGTVDINGQQINVKGMSAFDDIDTKLKAMESNVTAIAKKSQGMIDKMKELTEKNIEDNRKAEQERLDLDAQKEERTIADNKRKAVDSKIAEMAIKGRMGSDGAQAQVEEAKHYYEDKLSELTQQVSVRRTEINAKYTGLYTTAMGDYYTKSLANLKDSQAALERIEMQGITNTQTRQTKESEILTNLVKNTTDLRKETATTLYNAGKDMQTFINQDRDDKRAQETLGWTVLDKAIDDYGTNIPKSLLDRIGKMIPGVDLTDIAKAKTLAQMKKTGDGSGGGGIGFSISQRQPNGKAQTLMQFMAQKEKDFNKTTAGPISPDQRKSWENEYKALAAEDERLSPTAIMRDFQTKRSKAGTFSTLGQAKTTASDVEAAIRSGDYGLARNIVDGLGRPPPEKTAARISNLERLINSLDEMDALLNDIENNVGPLPTQGPLWTFINEHVETSPEFQRMQTLKNTNLAPYSRSVSGETGASTEGDVSRAVSGLLQANVSAPAMRAALSESKRQSQMAIALYLKSLRDTGYAVTDLQNSYDSNSWQSTPTQSNSFSLTSEQQAWLDSK